MRYLLIALLGGCGLSPTYMANVRDAEVQANATSCEKLGYAKNTKENADCSLRMYEAGRQPTVNVR